MRALFCVFFATFLFTGVTVAAEEAQPLSEKKGKWSFSMSEPGADLKRVSSETQRKLRSSLQEVSRIITASPVMSPPKGFEARFWGSITATDRYNLCSGKTCPPPRPTATLALMLGRYEERKGTVRAAFNTPSTMDISLNNLGHLFAHLPVLYKDEEGYLIPEPQADGERAGMPTFVNRGHAVAVLTRNDTPLWLPVSRERYLRAALAAAFKGLAGNQKNGKEKQTQATEVSVISGKPVMVEEVRTWIDPVDEKKIVESSRSLTFELKEPAELLKERIKKFQAELDAMPPEQRTLPAKVAITAPADIEPPALLPPDSSGGVIVVTPNFSYFNPKLPPDAIQLVVVQWKFDGDLVYDPQKSGISATLNNQKLSEIYKTVDWQKLRAKVSRTAP